MAAVKRAARKYPAWVKCPSCDDFFCSIHRAHAYDCKCPAIDKWKVDPYSEGGKRILFKKGHS